MTIEKSILSLKDFPLQTYDKIRYRDTDRQGHVNNAVFATFFETGRVELLYDPDRPLFASDGAFVIAGLNIELVHELVWPGRVDIGTGVTRIGRSSIHMVQALFQNGLLCAVAHTVIVHIDETSKRSASLPDATRQLLEGLMEESSGIMESQD